MEEASQSRAVHQGPVGSGLQVCDDTASLIPRPSPTSGTPACWMVPCSLCVMRWQCWGEQPSWMPHYGSLGYVWAVTEVSEWGETRAVGESRLSVDMPFL